MPRGCNLVHWIPGRIRLTHPSLGDLAARLELTAYFAALPGTRTLRVNTHAKSIALTYESADAPRASKPPHGDILLARAFSALETISGIVDLPLLSFAFEIIEAYRLARASWRVMQRRHRGMSVHGLLAFLGLLALRTSLLDVLLPRFARKIIGAVRSIVAHRATLAAFA